LDFLATQDFAFGTRFHGNVAALLAGTPAMLLTHDSRTAELAEYHGIPHRSMATVVAEQTDASELYDAADFESFNALMPRRFATYVAFLDRNELPHVFAPGQDAAEFDARVSAADFPEPVRTLTAPDGSQVAARLRWLRDGQQFDAKIHKGAFSHPYPHPPRPDAGSRARAKRSAAAALAAQHTKQLATARTKIERQKDLIKGLEKRLARLEQQRLRARLGRIKRRLLRR
jgi:hypothetical protein